MAMIKCPECSADVSDTALKCPSCGVQLRKPKRSFFGKLIKWSFIGFNVLMALWIFGGLSNVSEVAQSASSEAGRAGAVVGGAIGATMLFVLWVVGDLILGLFVLLTRPKS